jgi:hypothetical protein
MILSLSRTINIRVINRPFYKSGNMLVTKQKSVRVTKLENYGSAHHPSYTIGVTIEISVEESPDTVHKMLTGTGLIGRETIPFDPVPNFRGSADDKPFYAAVIMDDDITKRYEVAAHDTGGMLRTEITYEPVVTPEELRLSHPADFSRLAIIVEEWELHNYKHYFMHFIASKRYESFDLWVRRERGGDLGFTSITLKLAESELTEKRAPCSWYVNRLSIFKGVNLEEEVREKLGAP